MAVEVVLGWALPALLFVVSLALLYLYGTRAFDQWKQLGVPGPKPKPFVGNALDLKKKGFFGQMKEWRATYGPVYGMYMFHHPALVVSDLDIIKEVNIKDFNNFATRETLLGFPLLKRPMSLGLPFVGDAVWRRQRHTLTPTFSAAKLKQMSRFISRCCDNLLKSMTTTAQAGKSIDVKRTFGSYTLDVIAGTGFGMETNSLEEQDNVFLNAVIRVFKNFGVPTLPVMIASVFPFTVPLLHTLGFTDTFSSKDVQLIMDTISSLIEERKKSGRAEVDLLQLILSAEATEEHVKQNPDEKCLTSEEVLVQAVFLFIAGYETTGTTLQYTSYLLAMNPHIQEKLHDEVVKAMGDEEPCYENVSKISYLDSCIYETLRFFPPLLATSRKAKETRTIKDITIPAGASVLVPICAIMNDEGYFPEPDKFLPDRYEEGGCSSHVPTIVKELPFGIGPRQCLGMRLALYEAKMALAALVRKIVFVRIPETPEKITLSTSSRISNPDTPILVGVKLRK